jgi:O-antigen/teichoic acid export membrane protein
MTNEPIRTDESSKALAADELPSRRRALPAGLVDSATSSLASFGVGLYATRYLEPAELGIYALFFSAFTLSCAVPALLVCTPIEVKVLGIAPARRIGALAESVRAAVPVAIGAALVVCPAALLVASDVPLEVRLALAFSVTVAATVSPLQDHIRRMLHLSGRSWSAAALSAIHLATVAGVLITLSIGGIDPAWVPFTALAAGNIASAGAGFVHASRSQMVVPRLGARWGELLAAGGWLLGGELWGLTSGVLAIAAVTSVAGASDVGFAEAARVLSQPVPVAAIGVLSVLAPSLMDPKRHRGDSNLQRLALGVVGSIAGLGFLWMLVAGVDWPFSPLPELFPAAFVIGGLLPLVIIGQALGYSSLGFRSVLVGARQERRSGISDFVSSTAGLATAVVLARHGAFALAWAGVVGGLVSLGVRAMFVRRTAHSWAETAEE